VSHSTNWLCPLFDQLSNFAHWLTRDRSEAEDLVQETYTKALRGFSSFQLGTNFRAWMYRILRNTFLTSRTGLKQTITVPLELEKGSLELPIERETPEAMPGRGSDLYGPEARNFRIHFPGAGLSGRPRRALQACKGIIVQR